MRIQTRGAQKADPETGGGPKNPDPQRWKRPLARDSSHEDIWQQHQLDTMYLDLTNLFY